MTDTAANRFIAPALIVVASLVASAALAALALSIGRSAGSTYHTPPWALVLHLATVIPALPLGAWMLWARKGDTRHKMLGRVWGVMMIVTAITSFWIRDLTGSIGPIHIFSAVTLVSIPLGVYRIRTGNVVAHRRAMTYTYMGLCGAGLYALVPGRLLGTLIFG
jgi:uncharacterized membrane protein